MRFRAGKLDRADLSRPRSSGSNELPGSGYPSRITAVDRTEGSYGCTLQFAIENRHRATLNDRAGGVDIGDHCGGFRAGIDEDFASRPDRSRIRYCGHDRPPPAINSHFDCRSLNDTCVHDRSLPLDRINLNRAGGPQSDGSTCSHDDPAPGSEH